MLTTEVADVLDESPYLFVRQLPAKSDHAGSGRSVFYHPENFAFRTMAPESMLLEIPWRRFQLSGQRPIAIPLFPMTVEAGALAVVDRLTLRDSFRDFGKGS
jgi:hypothetical protein